MKTNCHMPRLDFSLLFEDLVQFNMAKIQKQKKSGKLLIPVLSKMVLHFFFSFFLKCVSPTI